MQVCAENRSTCKKTKEIETNKNAGMVQETVPVKTKERETKTQVFAGNSTSKNKGDRNKQKCRCLQATVPVKKTKETKTTKSAGVQNSTQYQQQGNQPLTLHRNTTY